MDDIRTPLPTSPTKFLDQFRTFMRADGKSYSTENAYVYWVKQFILFNQKLHPQEMGNLEVAAYLTHLAACRDASANTQKLALNALMFMYNRFLQKPIEHLNFKYAKKPIRTPTVFTHDEALSIINNISKPYRLMAQLMYGSGLLLWTNKKSLSI